MFIYDQQGAVRLGREEGKQEGREEGIKQGIEQEKLAIARKLLNQLDDEAIAQTTGLSIEAIRDLRKEQ